VQEVEQRGKIAEDDVIQTVESVAEAAETHG